MKQVFTTLFALLLFGSNITINAQCFTGGTGGSMSDFTIPINTNTVTISATGAGGGDEVATGGSGGDVTATFSVNVGDVLRVIVGAAGVDNANTAGGGGGTAVINCGNPADCPNGTLLVVAGGGGGAGNGFTGGGAVINPGSGAGGGGSMGAGGGGVNGDGINGIGSTGGQEGLETAVSSAGTGDANGGAGFGAGGGGLGSPTFKGGGGGGGYTGGTGGLSQGGAGGSNFIDASNFGSSSNFAGIAGGSGGDNSPGFVTIACALLPIELLDFNADKNGEMIELHWRTGAEINNRGFDIERSSDAAYWQTIGFVPGQGTSPEMETYRYADEQPMHGLNYRLKQMDFDGQYEYSKILSVVLDDSESHFRLFPNPATNSTTLEVTSGYTGQAEWELFDFIGQRIMTRSILLDGSEFYHHIDLSQMSSGIYFLRMQLDNEQWQRRLVIE